MKEKMNSQQPKIIISGGGTGGHIFPAIAIADCLKKRYPQADILFIGAENRMEMDRVPKAGYPIEGLWISGFKRELSLDNLSFPFKLISSMLKARKILKRFKPDVVIGVGGFASGPTMKTAASMGIPIVIQEQNSYPGITNKIVAKKAAKICVAYENMEQWFPKDKIVLTGNPLRNNIVPMDDRREEGVQFFGLDPEKKTILLVGGSQGALGINRGISAQLASFKENDYQMIWQTGKPYYEKALKEVEENGLQDRIKCTVFIDRMDLAYAAADVVISRAGAMSISELSLLNKAVVFVPLPTAAEDHQTKNAMSLVNANAAMIVKNAETEKELLPIVFELLKDEDRQNEMKGNIARFARLNAAEDIVDQIEKILNK
ncbi:MAG: undecaprenyldiphospho-muramoylpentapeptide beta-N-acetylglucosaminyltransferase [Bacteroidales bacterium]|nr:undecaprenyldiphospho-muramoylpentapeptide beta-N-acetylglucosaminyltransferase [Bacteroidales bacterium]